MVCFYCRINVDRSIISFGLRDITSPFAGFTSAQTGLFRAWKEDDLREQVRNVCLKVDEARLAMVSVELPEDDVGVMKLDNRT